MAPTAMPAAIANAGKTGDCLKGLNAPATATPTFAVVTAKSAKAINPGTIEANALSPQNYQNRRSEALTALG